MKPLTFGVIGVGRFGRHYVRLLQDIKGAVLAAVAVHSEAHAKEMASLLPLAIAVYTSGEKLLTDAAIDCVVIAAPASTHYGLCSLALGKGIHVLVEKPMVTLLADARRLQKVVKKYGRTFMVGHQYFYHDALRHLKRDLARGALGRVQWCFAEHFSRGPLRTDVDLLWDTITHELAIMDFLFEPRTITRVSGRGVGMRGTKRNDFISATVSFDRGPMLAFVTSLYWPQKTRRITIAGEKGLARFDDGEPTDKLQYIKQPFPSVLPEEGRSYNFPDKDIVIPSFRAREPLRNELGHFIDCVRKGKRPLTDIDHGVKISSFLDTIAKKIT